MAAGRGEVGWGVLGCGNISESQFIPAVGKAVNARLVALGSRDAARASELADRFHAERAHGGYNELLEDAGVRAVYIAVPNSFHKEWTIKAAQKGKHVLCEKPMALNEDECRAMIDACRDNGVLLMEAFMYRYHPQHRRLKEILSSGAMGEVRLIRSSFCFPLDLSGFNVRSSQELGGGSLMDLGCYTVNFSRWTMGTEPVAVSAWAAFSEKFGVDMSFGAILDFSGGRRGVIDCGFDTARKHAAEVVGTRGRIEAPAPWRPNGNPGILRIITEGEVQEETLGPANAYTAEIEHFSDCILHGTQPLTPGEDGRMNMRVIDACYRSAREGRRVGL